VKIFILGTCSGTEPYPGRHHVGFAIEHEEQLFWFDAGECCSYTAHVMGVDLMKLHSVFISHTHMDHVGGLGNLFWTVRKIDKMPGDQHVKNKQIGLYIPNMVCWDGILQMLKVTEGNFETDFEIKAREYQDGVILDECGVKVTALHTHHLPHEEGDPWRAFGFMIETEGKKIVYSGDTGGIDDYASLMENCDLLLMETGHHHPPVIAQELKKRKLFPKKLAFIHHGRDILDRYDENVAQLEKICSGEYVVLDDAVVLDM